jgi:hypothetical protein
MKLVVIKDEAFKILNEDKCTIYSDGITYLTIVKKNLLLSILK